MALLTWREMMEAVSARNMELYQNMRPVWESHGVVWYQPNRQNWVIPRVLEVIGSAEVSIRRRTQLAMTCVSGVL
jgi:hypothetical protein